MPAAGILTAAQCSGVPSTASSADPGQDGTSNGSVLGADVGGIISETPGTYVASGAMTWMT
jgi:hypothetical protein